MAGESPHGYAHAGMGFNEPGSAGLWRLRGSPKCLRCGKRRQSLGIGGEIPEARALVGDPIPWWEKYVVRSAIPALSIRISHIRALAGLPELHKDPFDRLLVAQSLVEGLTLVSKDETLARYGVPVIW